MLPLKPVIDGTVMLATVERSTDSIRVALTIDDVDISDNGD